MDFNEMLSGQARTYTFWEAQHERLKKRKKAQKT